MDRRLVEEDAVRVLAVLAERLAVVARDHDEGAVVQLPFAETREEAPDRRVDARDLAVVRILREALLVRGRRVVRVVRVVEVHPDEHRPGGAAVEPGERTGDDLAAAPLLRRVRVGAVLARPEARVVDVEAAVEAGSDRPLRVEDHRAHERGRAVAGELQQRREVGDRRRQREAEVLHPVERRVRAGEDRGVRDGRHRRLRVRALEHDGLAGERVERGREALPRRAEEPHTVGAHGVERDEHDVGRRGRGRARAEDGHREQKIGEGVRHRDRF